MGFLKFLLYFFLSLLVLGWVLRLLAPWILRMVARRLQKRMMEQMREFERQQAAHQPPGMQEDHIPLTDDLSVKVPRKTRSHRPGYASAAEVVEYEELPPDPEAPPEAPK